MAAAGRPEPIAGVFGFLQQCVKHESLFRAMIPRSGQILPMCPSTKALLDPLARVLPDLGQNVRYSHPRETEVGALAAESPALANAYSWCLAFCVLENKFEKHQEACTDCRTAKVPRAFGVTESSVISPGNVDGDVNLSGAYPRVHSLMGWLKQITAARDAGGLPAVCAGIGTGAGAGGAKRPASPVDGQGQPEPAHKVRRKSACPCMKCYAEESATTGPHAMLVCGHFLCLRCLQKQEKFLQEANTQNGAKIDHATSFWCHLCGKNMQMERQSPAQPVSQSPAAQTTQHARSQASPSPVHQPTFVDVRAMASQQKSAAPPSLSQLAPTVKPPVPQKQQPPALPSHPPPPPIAIPFPPLQPYRPPTTTSIIPPSTPAAVRVPVPSDQAAGTHQTPKTPSDYRRSDAKVGSAPNPQVTPAVSQSQSAAQETAVFERDVAHLQGALGGTVNGWQSITKDLKAFQDDLQVAAQSSKEWHDKSVAELSVAFTKLEQQVQEALRIRRETLERELNDLYKDRKSRFAPVQSALSLALREANNAQELLSNGRSQMPEEFVRSLKLAEASTSRALDTIAFQCESLEKADVAVVPNLVFHPSLTYEILGMVGNVGVVERP